MAPSDDDITQRQLAEAALRVSEKRFRFLAETMPSLVWTSDPNGVMTYVNQRWLDYCGLPRDRAAQWPQLTLHPDDYDRCIAEWMRALNSGEPYEIEARIRRHDGEYRWFITRAVPQRDEGGAVLGWFGVTTDIDDQKQLHQQLREADRRKDVFLATLAHELRNPLAPIRNAIQLLNLKCPPDPDLQWAREVIERQTRQLTRLVDDLLDVSRITRNKIELRKERVALAGIIDNAIETSRPLLDAARQRLGVVLPPAPVYLEGDPLRLAQMFANLLNNAAKYTPPGGEIRVTAERDGAMVVVRVSDNGVGIPPAMLPHIFEMFAQADPSLARSQGGLGIGLSLVRRFAELHGGSAEAASAGPGKGSEFTVRLPVAGAEAPAAAPHPPPTQKPPSTEQKILVVDDNRDAATMMSLVLRSMGHQVRTAHDGLQAVTTAASFHPDAVLLDIGLPKLNGYDAARRIREQPWGKDMKLIALTGWGQDEDRRRSMDAGFDHHLVKPVSSDVLHAVLERPREQPA